MVCKESAPSNSFVDTGVLSVACYRIEKVQG
jgi:hypothetical protein